MMIMLMATTILYFLPKRTPRNARDIDFLTNERNVMHKNEWKERERKGEKTDRKIERKEQYFT